METVNYQELNSLLYGVLHFQPKVPKRWEMVAEFIRSQPIISGTATLKVPLSGYESTSKQKHYSLKDGKNCKTVHKLLEERYPHILQNIDSNCLFKNNEKTPFKPIIFLPYQTSCCDKAIKIHPRCSYPIVYTLAGTLVGALYHGECYTCSTRYYPNYRTIEDGKRYYIDPNINDFFQVTSSTVFEKRLLEEIANNIWISGTSLESRAKVNNCTFGAVDEERLASLKNFDRTIKSGWQLNEQRVGDGFFLWLIINFYNNKHVLQQTAIEYDYLRDSSRHLNIEDMCENVWRDICTSKNKWISHECKRPGCTEGYVTIDGNEYLKRSKCAAPIEKIKPRKDLP